MIQGMIGKKLGSTRIFDESGNDVAVTVLRAGPCVVLQVKREQTDGYSAAQLALVEDDLKVQRLTKALQGHLEKAGAPPVKVIREFPLPQDSEAKPGDRVTVELFAEVSKVDVTGTSKGRGFQGVVRRHGFAGGKASHGSMFHRSPGSIGMAAYPAKVFKGTKMPGQMGARRVTQHALRVVKVDPERHLLLVRGGVPGPVNGYVYIRPALRG